MRRKQALQNGRNVSPGVPVNSIEQLRSIISDRACVVRTMALFTTIETDISKILQETQTKDLGLFQKCLELSLNWRLF